jgi:carbon storage regulator
VLYLDRKVGQRIYIGDDIQLVVKRIGKDKVKIGILRPPQTSVLRGEVHREINAQGKGSDEDS